MIEKNPLCLVGIRSLIAKSLKIKSASEYTELTGSDSSTSYAKFRKLSKLIVCQDFVEPKYLITDSGFCSMVAKLVHKNSIILAIILEHKTNAGHYIRFSTEYLGKILGKADKRNLEHTIKNLKNDLKDYANISVSINRTGYDITSYDFHYNRNKDVINNKIDTKKVVAINKKQTDIEKIESTEYAYLISYIEKIDGDTIYVADFKKEYMQTNKVDRIFSNILNRKIEIV